MKGLGVADWIEPSAATEGAHLNRQVAARLDQVADVLAGQGASRYRVEAYRRGATVVRTLDRPVEAILREAGLEGLQALPSIGESLARAIRDLVLTGRLPMLERLRGAAHPVARLRSIPGIGPRTAERVHDVLGVETLEELEAAAHDGRLERMGVGPKRLAGIRESLAQRLGPVRRPRPAAGPEPPVVELLDVDAEYRAKAAAGALPRIAPRRFNAAHEAWLPILHTQRGERQYTALFSNTARAHRLGRTRDWVILYVDGAAGERRYTVVTVRRGPRQGSRVVAGRGLAMPPAPASLTPAPHGPGRAATGGRPPRGR
jgi:DNA polymerase (family X)